MTRASLDKRPQDVAAMFDDVAAKYDRTNDVLSLGQDRRWRKLVRAAVGARRGDTVLDIAAGTGTSSEPFADAGVNVVPADFSLGMLRVGNRRRPDLAFTAADALRLPFADDSFDAVTMSFGLRNVVGTSGALEEFLRVTKPGGSLVICEFSHPSIRVFRTVYSGYLMRALPSIARKVSSNPRLLRLPGRVDPGLAGPGRYGASGHRGGVAGRGLAQPVRRHRRPAPCHQAG